MDNIPCANASGAAKIEIDHACEPLSCLPRKSTEWSASQHVLLCSTTTFPIRRSSASQQCPTTPTGQYPRRRRMMSSRRRARPQCACSLMNSCAQTSIPLSNPLLHHTFSPVLLSTIPREHHTLTMLLSLETLLTLQQMLHLLMLRLLSSTKKKSPLPLLRLLSIRV